MRIMITSFFSQANVILYWLDSDLFLRSTGPTLPNLRHPDGFARRYVKRCSLPCCSQATESDGLRSEQQRGAAEHGRRARD
jgi:hypothetical protein